MWRQSTLKNPLFWIIIAVDAVLLLSVFLIMGQVQRLLNNDIQVNVTEIATQNKDVVNSKLMLEVNNLDLVAKQLSSKYAAQRPASSESDDDVMRSIFLRYANDVGDDTLFWANQQGTALFYDGQEIDISGRAYFRHAITGNQNISERTVSRRTGEDIFVISVPISYNDAIIGTIQRQYTPGEMYKICSLSLFSQQGQMYIVNSEGYILLSSQQESYNRDSDNYFRMLYLTNPDAARKLESDIKSDQAGFMQIEIDGKPAFAAYTPIEDLYDWYLISSVSTDAVAHNSSIVSKLFLGVLLAMVFFIAFSALYVLFLKNKQQADLEHTVFVDTVTNGDTMAKFLVDLQRLYNSSKNTPLYIFTLDIENFKYINSNYGFLVGDHILRDIYEIYQKKLATGERIARVSGDHYVLLLEDISPARIDALFEPELNPSGIKVYLMAGLCPIPYSGTADDVHLMVDKANTAAKATRGKREKKVAIYTEEYDREIMHNEETKRAVEAALANDEILPFFQPKVDIHTRTLVGAEALARWRTQEGKLIPPGEFIPVCEATGLISQLDMAIFEKTLRFLRQNLDKGVKCVPISVNFSRSHLFDETFLSRLLGKLKEYDIPAELIELELTESAIFDNYDYINEFIESLHAHGLKVSMDDFGSGYSSLNMLKDVDIDVVKIDRGFLQDTVHSDRQTIIFGAISQMALQLNLQIVVEGVETQQNIDLMREFGCTVAQGYYYSKPLGRMDFEKLYEEGRVE